MSYKDAEKHIYGDDFYNNPLKGLESSININKESQKEFVKNSEYNFVYEEFNPDDYLYTRLRGFTQNFCKTFGIVKAISGFYEDYFIIPIKDRNKNINEFEARKLLEYERSLKFFNIDNNNDYKKVRGLLKSFIKANKIKIKERQLYFKDKPIINSELIYLVKPKVLYPFNSKIDKTLFNMDNLNFNEDLYLSEGLGTVPKVWLYVSKNVTCPFGVQLEKPTVFNPIENAQLNLFQKFNKRIIVIPDHSDANRQFIWTLTEHLPDIWVADINSDDTDDSFVHDLKNAEIIESSRYLIKKAGL